MTSTHTSAVANPAPEERLPGSASTWRVTAPEPRIPADLHVDTTLPPRERLARWKARHALRRTRARSAFDASRNPERGLPVAHNQKAFAFIGSRSFLPFKNPRTAKNAAAAFSGRDGARFQ